MRVTNANTYRNFTSSVNNVHLTLNKSMNKITTRRAYEAASDEPLSYYRGKKIDNQYQDTLSKLSLVTDVKNRLYEQELGARDIQGQLSEARKTIIYAKTGTTTGTASETLRDALLSNQHNIVNDLNVQYQDFFVFGGNDVSTPPFSLSGDGTELTFSHIFPGEDTPIDFKFTLTEQTDGSYAFELDPACDKSKLISAMTEQGRMDLGYGDIRDRDTLTDTYTGGLNVLSGLTSDAILQKKAQGMNEDDLIKEILGSPDSDYGINNGPLGLIGQAVQSINKYVNKENADGSANADYDDRVKLDKALGELLDKIPVSEHISSTVYSDLGNKYKILEDTEDRLKTLKLTLTEQYTDTVGADPYESIMEMFNNQYSYNAALQVGSKLLSSSLFDFVR